MNNYAKVFLSSAFLLTLASCFSVGHSVPVVPAAEAPPPEAGKGWFCHDVKQSSGKEWSNCTRKEDVCNQASKAVNGMVLFNITTTTTPCVAQATAWCTYVWKSNADKSHDDCRKSSDQCTEEQNDTAIDDTTKRSTCRAAN